MRNRYNQAPHLTQDTNGKVTTSQLDITNERQEFSPFPAGDHNQTFDILNWNFSDKSKFDIRNLIFRTIRLFDIRNVKRVTIKLFTNESVFYSFPLFTLCITGTWALKTKMKFHTNDQTIFRNILSYIPLIKPKSIVPNQIVKELILVCKW